LLCFFFSSRRRHTRFSRDWSSDVCSSDLEKYEQLIHDLFKTDTGRKQGKELIDYHFNLIASLSNDLFTPTEEKIILAQGELLSTTLWHFHLSEKGIPSVLLPALDFMKIDEDNEPVIPYIKEKLEQ